MLLGFSQCDNHAAFKVKHAVTLALTGETFWSDWNKRSVKKCVKGLGCWQSATASRPLLTSHATMPSFLWPTHHGLTMALPDQALSVHAHTHARTNPRSPWVLTLLLYIFILYIHIFSYCLALYWFYWDFSTPGTLTALVHLCLWASTAGENGGTKAVNCWRNFKIKAYLFLNYPLTCYCLIQDRSTRHELSHFSSWVIINFRINIKLNTICA